MGVYAIKVLIEETSLDNEIKNLVIYKKALYNADDAEESDHISLLESINLADDSEDYKWYSSNYNKFFPENIDTLIDSVIIDTVIEDTVASKDIKSLMDFKTGKIVFDDSLKININIPDNIKIKSEVIDTTIKNNDAIE